MTEIKPTNLTQIPAGVDVAQPRVQTDRAAAPEVSVPQPQAPRDGVEQSRGVQVRGQDQTLATAQPKGAEALTTLAQLTKKMGPIGAEAAQRGDVDFAVATGALFNTPKAEHQATFRQIGAAMTGEDVFLQGRVCAALGAYQASGQVAQQQDATRLFHLNYQQANAQLRPVIDSFASASAGFTDGGKQALSNFAPSFPQDINDLVQWVLREAYLENLQDLAFYAQKVRFYNNLKKKIREEATRARNELSNNASKKAEDYLSSTFDTKEFDSTYYGPSTSVEQAAAGMTDEEKAQFLAEKAAAQDAAEQAAEAERQERIAEWEAKPATDYPAQPVSYGQDFGKDKSYDRFDDVAAATVEEVLAQISDLTPEQKEALMEQIIADGGISIGAYCSETDWTNHEYRTNWSAKDGKDKPVDKIAPRPGETLEAYLTRAITKTMTDFKGQVKRDEGDIKIIRLDMQVRLPEYSAKEPLPPELGGSSAGLSSAGPTEWKQGQPVETKAQLEAYVKNLEEQLSSVGDDAQLANVDMQNMLQKQQQTLQMMSNISKMIHDTAMAIIRKIGS